MRQYIKEQVTKTEDILVSVTCDCCKKEVDILDTLEIQEFLSLTIYAGYGSVLGDGKRLETDLCQYCVQKLLGKYLRIMT